MGTDLKQKMRENLIRMRVYRFCAFLFVAFGIIMFAFLYMNYLDGDPMQAITRPITTAMILIPFMPAAVLAWMSMKEEKKMSALLETMEKSS